MGPSLDARPQHRWETPLKLVELFAFPGAGKSTLVEAIAGRALVATRKDLSAEWAARPALQRVHHVGRGFANYRRLAAAARVVTGARLTTRESNFRLMKLIAKTGWLRSRSGVVLLDQGFLQDLWSILLSSRSATVDPARLAPLIRALYDGIDATVVVVDVDPETASDRVAGRPHGHSRFDGLPEPQRVGSLQSADQLLRQIIAAARLAGLPVQTIDGMRPSAEVAQELLALLPAEKPAVAGCPAGPRPRRISIVGATGSGKTWLARELADRLGLTICELDRLKQEAGSGKTFERRVAEIAERGEWIIDGHYRDVRHLIWRRAEAVVWLNYPLPIVAQQLVRRFRAKHRAPGTGARPPNEPESAIERVTWSRRLRRLARTLRERSAYGRLLRSDAYRGTQIIELRSVAATREWLRQL